MRRYLFITLLLSLLLPLHVAASIYLSAPTCPAEATMSMKSDASTNESVPDCCDEQKGSMDCEQMPGCQGCNINGQLFLLFTPDFTFSFYAIFPPTLNEPFVASFDPASVWRPPTNS
jgi:hypothetical protein